MLEPCVRLPEKTPAGTVGKAVQSERSSNKSSVMKQFRRSNSLYTARIPRVPTDH